MQDDPVDGLLPWLVSGTDELDPDRRQQLEQRLSSSADARELKAVARLLANIGAPERVESFLEEVHPRLLVQYAEDPERLDDETRQWIATRLATGASVADELEALRRADAAADLVGESGPGDTAPAVGKPDSLWRRTWQMVLHPSAAAGYLAAAAALAIAALVA